MFVNAPVATIQAVSGGVERSADAMAGMHGSDRAGIRGSGRREVPSRPESPS